MSKRTLMRLAAAIWVALTAVSSSCAAPVWVWVDPRDPGDAGLSSLPVEELRALGVEGFLFPGLMEGVVHHPSNLLPNDAGAARMVEKIRALRAKGFQVGLYFQVYTHGGRLDRPNHLARLRPEWLSVSVDGSPLRRFVDGGGREKPFLDGLFFDPGVPKFREFYIALLTEALESISPDLIVLDQVGFPMPEPFFEGISIGEQPYGHHPVARGNFKKDHGWDPLAASPGLEGEPSPEPGEIARRNSLWKSARRDSVSEFVRSIHRLVTQGYPRTRLTAVVHPDPFQARETLLQDWPRWLREGWVETVALPAHEARWGIAPDIGVLDSSLREKIWLAGTYPADSRPNDFLAGIGEGLGERGWIIFEERPGGFPVESIDSEPVADEIHDNLLKDFWLARAADAAHPPAESLPASPPPSSARTLEVRALYGFDPEKPPFDHLSPDGVAEKLVDLGFNAVFGGAQPPELRAALRGRGIRRFGEHPVFVGRTYWDQDPSTRPVAADGKPIARQSWYAPLDPHLAWLREVKRAALLDRVREQELDGVWLDFIRFPVFWEEVPPKLVETSFSPAALTAFQEETGIVPEGETASEMAEWILANADAEWRRFRSRTILDFVREVEAGLREISPDILLGAFVLPWRPEEHGGALYRIAGQDLEGFAEIVDILSPMLYSHQLGRPPGWIAERVSEIAAEVEVPLHPIVQCFDEPTPMPDADVERAIRMGGAAPSRGVILFSQRHLESSGRWELVRNVLRDLASEDPVSPSLSSP